MRPVFLLLGATLVATLNAARGEQLTLKDIAAARKMYVGKCAKCHKFHDPKNYAEADWSRWISSMSRRSKLKAEQEALLKRYLQEYRAGSLEKVR
jgi:cytochrome c553